MSLQEGKNTKESCLIIVGSFVISTLQIFHLLLLTTPVKKKSLAHFDKNLIILTGFSKQSVFQKSNKTLIFK